MHVPINPLIGITCGGKDNLPKYPDLYIDAVKKAGGHADYIYPDEDVSELSGRCDGFIIPGGKDLDPAFYNEGPLFKIDMEDLGRTSFEITLLSEIIKAGKPLFGVCYGAQLINVFLKGALYQDINMQTCDSFQHTEGVHLVSVDGNPYIERGEFNINTSHHQAIRKLGEGLKAFAFSPDGIIEAIYCRDHNFMVGVQWHPERTNDILSERIFRSFVGGCRARV